MKLKDTLRALICEVASIESVVDCIKKKEKCIIYYSGDTPGGPGFREIEPVCLGVSKQGNKVVRAWEIEGASHTAYLGKKPLPGWRYFRLDKIMTLRPTGENFTEMRPKFNPNGDKSMENVILVANF